MKGYSTVRQIALLFSLLLNPFEFAAAKDAPFLNSVVQVDRRVVTVPEGDYVISEPIVQTVAHQVVYAEGVTIRRTKDFKGEAVWIFRGVPEKRLAWAEVRGLTIRGKGVAGTGILADWTTRLTLDRCVIRDFNGSGLVLRNGFDTGVSHSCVMACGNRELLQPAVELSAEGDGTKTITLSNVTVEDYRGVGIFARNQFSARFNNCKVHGSKGEAAEESELGVHIRECNGVRLTDTLMVGIGEMMLIEDSKDVEVKGTIERTR